MTQEEKQLLLKDLCGRLPYGVFVEENRTKLDLGPVIYTYDYHPCIDNCKPYLRPMSSMTEEECKEYYDLCHSEEDVYTHIYYYNTIESIDWLNTHHFDYRGLVEKGLALEAPKDMYIIK